MGQYWHVLCIDNRQSTGHLGKLGEVFYSDPHILEDELLRYRPVDHPVPDSPPVAPLERLPPLIKRRICAFLAAVDVDGLLCVILAIPHMAADGQAALSSHLSWAGKRIITLGDYAEDLPQNLLTADEEKRLLNRGDRSSYVLDVDVFDKRCMSDLSKAYPRAHRFTATRDLLLLFMRIQNRLRRRSSVSLERVVRPPPSRPANAVLRNLTLKQYYRSDSHCCSQFCGRCKNNKDDDASFGLGQVVLIMTCWSQDTSTAFHADWTVDDVHGEWAGHRLDIAALENVPADWEDVTETVRAKLMRLRDQPE
ncbi:hypothetical protein H4R21_000348 [Coemansia helicoidea]|uniref:Uncharacterized protein n=1 Tax=Coemansia helicoidea TaxID=1286919 RepID=A0ACC1LGT8_9FUNG|nr:hypothetical protein H4R21_000348 [Coemansia helicoidea]